MLILFFHTFENEGAVVILIFSNLKAAFIPSRPFYLATPLTM